jgi:hypothetical protein
VPIDAYLSIKGVVSKHTVRIVPTNDVFPKLLKAMSNTNNTVETQEKALYFIEKYVDERWEKLTDINTSLLEVAHMGSHVIISDREANSFVCYGGK